MTEPPLYFKDSFKALSHRMVHTQCCALKPTHFYCLSHAITVSHYSMVKCTRGSEKYSRIPVELWQLCAVTYLRVTDSAAVGFVSKFNHTMKENILCIPSLVNFFDTSLRAYIVTSRAFKSFLATALWTSGGKMCCGNDTAFTSQDSCKAFFFMNDSSMSLLNIWP